MALPRAAGILSGIRPSVRTTKTGKVKPGGGYTVGPGSAPPSSVSPVPLPPPVYDYATDPQLQAEYGAAEAGFQQTEHGIGARRRQALLGYGSRLLAEQALGLGANDPFIQSIDENADTGTGALARLAHGYARNLMARDAGDSAHNLYYGSEHAKGLAAIAYANQQATADATRSVQAILEGLTEEDAAAATARTNSRIGSEGAARERALAWALNHPQAAGAQSQPPSLQPSVLARLAPSIGLPAGPVNVPQAIRTLAPPQPVSIPRLLAALKPKPLAKHYAGA